MIFIENRKKSKKNIETLHPKAIIIDVTSKGLQPFVKFSPFYPHGHIPVPFSENVYSYSLEGIWQGLKVFEKEGIDVKKFQIKDMKNIKRSVRKHGKTMGHQKGIMSTQLFDYLTARKNIYVPIYNWVLEHRLSNEIMLLKEKAQIQDIVLLDYETNQDIENISKPLSHAALIKQFLERKYPELLSGNLTNGKTEKPASIKSNKKQTKGKGKNSTSNQINILFE